MHDVNIVDEMIMIHELNMSHIFTCFHICCESMM